MAEQKMDLMGEAGVSGLQVSGGVPSDQPLKQLKGANAVKVWAEMSRFDPVVGAGLFAIEMLARQVPWRVEPGGDSPEAEELADFVDGCRSDMSHSWTDMLGEVLTYLPFGWEWSEIVYKVRNGTVEGSPGSSSKYADGKIGWRKIVGRAQETRERFDMDDSGGITALVQRDPNKGLVHTIPIEKSLLFRTTTAKGNPEGRSMLERAFTSWYAKKRIQEIEGIGIERDLAGFPVAWVPPQITATDATSADKTRYDTFEKMVTRIRRDEMAGAVMPLAYDKDGNKLYDLTLLTSGGSRQIDTDPVVKRYDQRIAATLLADFILLGTDSGNRALSADKSDMFETAMNTVLDEVAEVFNRHAIPRLLTLNGYGTDECPTLAHGGVERVDLDKLSSYILRLSQAGAPLFPDDQLEGHLREAARLPAIPEGERALRPPPPESKPPVIVVPAAGQEAQPEAEAA
ncbi:MAG: hypothetical protein WC718_07320 [Phycisphaerales bacterium]|jgi:hypothetical protein